MKNKGITLIALIITIAIMLILVGVTVSISLNSDLFKTSQETAFKTAIAKLEEQLYGPMQIHKYTGETYNYSEMIPDELKPYIEISAEGILMYIGEPNTQQAQWAKEENILGKQEYILKTTLEELVSLAKQYVEDGKSTTSSNLLALQYIRYQKSNYRSGNWKTLGGEIELGFVNYVNANKGEIFSIGDINDPVTGETIDFVHSMASLNVYVNQASSTDPIKQYACWAGDLCTFTEEIYQYYKSGSYTEAELKEYAKSKLGGSSTFGLADMLADADAVNISQLAKSGGDIDDIIYDYYYGNDSDKCKNRYKSFATYLKTRKSSSATTEQGKLYDVAWYYLGNHNDLFAWVEIYASELIDSYYSIPNVVFKTVATCFAEYICERM